MMRGDECFYGRQRAKYPSFMHADDARMEMPPK